MDLFERDGTLTAIGQSVFSNDPTVYAYLEITDHTGWRMTAPRPWSISFHPLSNLADDRR
jgi:hypothetical protein